MGKLIVIEGLDGSGKATQSDLLVKSLGERGYSPHKLSFPRYGTPACAPVEMYLAGRYGAHPEDVGCHAASVLYAVDRFSSFRTEWKEEYERGGLFVADRYTTSNGVYQAGKLARGEWGPYLEWLYDLEYNRMGIPKPDVVVYLDVTCETSRELMRARYGGDDGLMDIHERDIEFQRHCRDAAMFCAETGGWRIIRCDRDGRMRPVGEIAHEVLQAVTKGL